LGEPLERDTIFGVTLASQPPLHSLIQSASRADEPVGDEVSRVFKIRSADSYGQRSSATVLISRMYAARGYRTTPLPSQQLPTRVTLTASANDDTVGTITIGFDSDEGLHVDELFASETDALRRAGRKLCEFTKLAMDSVVRSKRVLASLFHVAYIYGYRVMGLDDLLIEVNPRHVRYYERMLGFEVFGNRRLNPRVNAPAVLMRLPFSHARCEIERFGGRPEYSLDRRSLYPHFFSIAEECSIVGRLRDTDSGAQSFQGVQPSVGERGDMRNDHHH
jgi:hypothetical protein